MYNKESDIYNPIKSYLESKKYSVYGEVQNCDLAAVKNKELIIIEFKTNLSLKLVLQGVERQDMTDSVYIAVSERKGKSQIPNQKAVIKLLKKLGLGLIVVHFCERRKEVEVLLNPAGSYPGSRKNYKRRKALLKEIGGRYQDFNIGGSVSRLETITAYRLKALEIAVMMEKTGPVSPGKLISQGAPLNTQSILFKNYYGWFIRISRGIYTLSEAGTESFKQFPEQAAYFREKLSGSI